jgi:hypothetical protein
MIWKIALVVLAAANGGWMLFDGMNVVRTGKYFGPELPGPWRHLPIVAGIDPYSMGPVFIMLGLGWIVSVGMVFLTPDSAFWLLVLMSALTLWYISIGTILSVLVLVILLWVRPI